MTFFLCSSRHNNFQRNATFCWIWEPGDQKTDAWLWFLNLDLFFIHLKPEIG